MSVSLEKSLRKKWKFQTNIFCLPFKNLQSYCVFESLLHSICMFLKRRLCFLCSGVKTRGSALWNAPTFPGRVRKAQHQQAGTVRTRDLPARRVITQRASVCSKWVDATATHTVWTFPQDLVANCKLQKDSRASAQDNLKKYPSSQLPHLERNWLCTVIVTKRCQHSNTTLWWSHISQFHHVLLYYSNLPFYSFIEVTFIGYKIHPFIIYLLYIHLVCQHYSTDTLFLK